MAKPIVEFITEDLVEAVARVSLLSGDATTLRASEPDATADSPQDSVAIVREADWTYEDNPPIGMDGIFQDYEVVFYVQAGDESNYGRIVRRYASDIKKRVMADENRGGYARWTKVTGVRKFSDGSVRGAILDVQVYFWTLQDTPDRQS
jgi:hypothetical protein